jgi:hypothetical protein
MSVKKKGKLLVLTSTTNGGGEQARKSGEGLLNCVYRDVLCKFRAKGKKRKEL